MNGILFWYIKNDEVTLDLDKVTSPKVLDV